MSHISIAVSHPDCVLVGNCCIFWVAEGIQSCASQCTQDSLLGSLHLVPNYVLLQCDLLQYSPISIKSVLKYTDL